MTKSNNIELIELIKRFAFQNALRYGGKAKVGPVIGKLFSIKPGLRAGTEDVNELVVKVVNEVNTRSLSEQKQFIIENWPELLEPEKAKSEKKDLPPLPNVEKYPVVHTRFCPNPDGALHIGGARAVILCDEYAKRYNGKLTLRFDDTDPRTKSPIPEAYEWIRNDLRWLGVKWNTEVYQSDRMQTYYDYTAKLLSQGNAYLCNCDPQTFKRLIVKKKSCICRDLPPEEHITRWYHMLDGTYAEGEVVVRIKTDPNHPNPAVREWPALRIIDTHKYPHPRTGEKFRVWPLFAFCGGIDDYLLKISHILRGKEHVTNTTRQLYLYEYLGWNYPEAIHYGRLKISGSVLSKSKIREGIEKGEFLGWDDPRLGTLMAIRKRGITPETVREIMIDLGPKPVDATLSWKNIYAINRKIIDSTSNRYFVVVDPIKLLIRGLEKQIYTSKPPLIPGHSEKGHRTLQVMPKKGNAHLYVSKKDLEILESNNIVRLMELFNIEIEKVRLNVVEGNFHSEPYMEAKKLNVPLIHWLPEEGNIHVKIVMPSGTTQIGLGESGLKNEKVNATVQMERLGFGKINLLSKNHAVLFYAHR